MDINQFMPVTGDIQSVGMAINDIKNKQYGSAALNGMGALPFVPSMAGIFLGKKGANNLFKNYGYDRVEKSQSLAQHLQDSGYDDPTIWRMTGDITGHPSTFAFPDGHLQTEISDFSSRFHPRAGKPSSDPLSDIFEQGKIHQYLPHSALQNAHPDLMNEDLIIQHLDPGVSAEKGPGYIAISPYSVLKGEDYAKKDILHELQHGVSVESGMGNGANAGYLKYYYDKAMPEIHTHYAMLDALHKSTNKRDAREVAQKMRNYAYDNANDPNVSHLITMPGDQLMQYARDAVKYGPEGLTPFIDDATAPIHNLIGGWSPFEGYMDTADEVKARLVERRGGLSMDDRTSMYPFSGAHVYKIDIPLDKQVVRGVVGSHSVTKSPKLADTHPASNIVKHNGVYRHEDDIKHFAGGGLVGSGGILDGMKLDMDLVHPSNKGSAPLDIQLNTNNMAAKRRAGGALSQLYTTRR